MAQTPNDGGPAFPTAWENPFGDLKHIAGMTLRDWFAGQVLAGSMLGEAMASDTAIQHDAMMAYRVADAMLAARSK